MLNLYRSAVLAAFALAPFCHAAQAQSFEDLVEGALQRQRLQAGESPQPTDPFAAEPTDPFAPQPTDPFAPQPTTTSPTQPQQPSAPQLQAVEPGPRPYTPPVTANQEQTEQPDSGGQSGGGQSGGTAPADASADTAAVSPDATNPAPDGATQDASGGGETQTVTPLAPGEERTRESLQAAEVNAATFSEEALAVGGANPLVLKAQVLLDRAGASPGVIDGYPGGNLARAVSAVETVLRQDADGKLDADIWQALRGDETQDVLMQYVITEQDLAYPFAASIPEDFAQQALLPSLAYSSMDEMLGERFHMDVKLIRALNPEADFNSAGTSIWVTSVEGIAMDSRLAFVVADRAVKQVRGYDTQDRLIVAYPATIGSAENPAPFGEFRVESIAPNPVYTYNPGALASADAVAGLTLPAGPNNPLGTTWIGLSGTNCGIHGAVGPTTVGKDALHGCIRLTNWDVEELAGLLEPGVVVSFR